MMYGTQITFPYKNQQEWVNKDQKAALRYKNELLTQTLILKRLKLYRVGVSHRNLKTAPTEER